MKEKGSESRGNFHSNLDFLMKAGFFDTLKGGRILEVGAGNGVMTEYLSKKGFDIIGTEIHEGYIKYAKKVKGLDLEKMDAEKLFYEDDTFDAIISFDVLEHIPNLNKHLEEARRVLKSGGCYFFQTPNKWTNIPIEVIQTKSLTKYKKVHCSLSSYWQLKKRFVRAGFDKELKFFNIPVVNNHFKNKMKKVFGLLGVLLVRCRIVEIIDRLPIFMRTNFYGVVKKA